MFGPLLSLLCDNKQVYNTTEAKLIFAPFVVDQSRVRQTKTREEDSNLF
jgi:hypothetical protein